MSRRAHRLAGAVFAAATASGAATLCAPEARAWDQLAYLLNVFARPGYHFADSAEALAYGYGICDRIDRGDRYESMIANIKSDMETSDTYQATYLIGQAANELCPGLIWQLRKSAEHYTPP